MSFKPLALASEHPYATGAAVFVLGLGALYFLGFFGGGSQQQAQGDSGLAQAYYAAQAASVATASQPPVAATSPAWLTEYDRILNQAQSAYSKSNYTLAKQEYNKALNLANRNGDRQKVTFVNGQIAECNKAIEVANKAAGEARQKEIQERLASYNFVGNFALGTDFLIVQRKSDNRWGIIRKDGKEAEAFNYSQVSARLKNGFFALKNDEGWVVFDTSMKKITTGLDKLDDYK